MDNLDNLLDNLIPRLARKKVAF